MGVIPDLTMLGKFMGGGLSFGALGGRADLMDRFDTARPESLLQAGTFCNNVLTMAAAHAGLTEVLSPDTLHALNRRGDYLRESTNKIFRASGLAACATGSGCLMMVHFKAPPIVRPGQLVDEDPRYKRLFHVAMMERGIYIAYRGMVALSLPIGDAEIGRFLGAVDDFVATYSALLPRG